MFLLSNGHILSELGFWIFFIPTIFVLSHVVLLIIIIPQWLLDGYFDPKKRKQDKGKAREQNMVQKLVRSITRKDIEGKDNGNRI